MTSLESPTAASLTALARAAALSVIAVGAAGQLAATAVASPMDAGSRLVNVGGKNRCDPVGPISLGFYDARRSAATSRTVAVSYERSKAGLQQRTIFLDSGGYVISACQPTGAIREERYEQIGDRQAPVAVSIADVAPDGTAVAVDATYPESANVPSQERLSASDQEKVITPPQNGTVSEVAPDARALAPSGLEPGRRSEAVVRPGRFTPASPIPDGPVVSPMYYSANKCYHNSGVNLGRKRSPRSFTYQSAIGFANAWMVNGGYRAFPDVWNYCGWTVGSGLSATMSAEVPTYAVTKDYVNHIGWGAPCTATAAACNYTWVDWDSSSGGFWKIVDNDIVIDPSLPYAAGAVPGHFDFQSVVAHEAGHSWGFGDFYGDPYGENHIMYGVLTLGVDDRRYLAYGDYQIMRTMYP